MEISGLTDIFRKYSTLMLYDPYSNQYISTTKERWYETEAKSNKVLHCDYEHAVGINSIIATLGGTPKKELEKVGWSLSDETCSWNMSFYGEHIQMVPNVTSLIDGVVWATIDYFPEPIELDRTDNILNEAL